MEKFTQQFIALLAVLLLNLLISNSPVTFAQAALGDLTEEQLGNLTPESLPRYNNLPWLPLYSISQSIEITTLHGTGTGKPLAEKPRVGIQVGHLDSEKLPAELSRLRGAGGASYAGVYEVNINQTVARLLGSRLTKQNIEVDILASTVPENYYAQAFISIHSDWSPKPYVSGFKLARSRYSLIPEIDDTLLKTLYSSYAKVTGLPKEKAVTTNMTGYYGFNNRAYYSTLNPATPAAIIELGFLTNAADRTFLTTHADLMAQGLAEGLLTFIKEQNYPITPLARLPTLQIKTANEQPVAVYNLTGQEIVAYISNRQKFVYFEREDKFYSIWLPVLNRLGYVKVTEAVELT